jgi:hypothetical protein
VGTKQILVGVKSVWVADGQIIIALNLWKNLAERVKNLHHLNVYFLEKACVGAAVIFHRQKIRRLKLVFLVKN